MVKRINIINTLFDISSGSHVIKMIDDLFTEVYLVGGAVRDEMLGKSTKDLDFAVPNNVDSIMQLLSEAGFEPRDYARQFSTISATVAGYQVQITSYRSEIYREGSRNPLVENIRDIDSDLSRRDFTVNAIALSRDGIIDPYDGVNDIKKGIIKSVGDPSTKFREDPLRILRAFRFVSTHGFDIEQETQSAAIKAGYSLTSLSQERIADEFKKLFNGYYWTDALYELADSSMYTHIFQSVNLDFDLNGVNIKSVLDKYTLDDLVSMDLISRLAIFILIIHDAEKGRGIKTSSLESIESDITSFLKLNKDSSAELKIRIESLSIDQHGIESLVSKLENEYKSISKGDSKSLIVQAKLSTAKGWLNLQERQYQQAYNNFLQSVTCTEKSFEIIKISNSSLDEQHMKLRQVRYHYMDRIILTIASYALKEKLHLKINSIDKLLRLLSKTFSSNNRLSKDDMILSIEEAIVILYRNSILGDSFPSFDDYILKHAIQMSHERKSHLVQKYYYTDLKDNKHSPLKQSEIYRKISNLHKNTDESESLAYYDPYIDSLFMRTLASRTADIFWERYDDLENETDNYVRIATKENSFKRATRRGYLNAAHALTHCLTLVNTLDDKLSVSRAIVANYKMAGAAYSRSANRFKLYLEWFSLLVYLRDKDATPNDTIDKINSSSILHYEDSDESFFKSSLPELASIRQSVRALYGFSYIIIGSNYKDEFTHDVLSNEILSSIKILLEKDIIDPVSSYGIIKNFYLRDVDKSIEKTSLKYISGASIEELDEDIELIKNGESETVELKAGWSYSIKAGRADKEISYKILKTITAFMNTEGGRIYLGVDDDGSINGLEQTDLKIATGSSTSQKIDSIKQKIDSLFIGCVKASSSRYTKISFKHLQDKTVVIIDVKKSNEPIYFNDPTQGGKDKFYIRMSSRTEELGAGDLIDYVTNRFSNYNRNNRPA